MNGGNSLLYNTSLHSSLQLAAQLALIGSPHSVFLMQFIYFSLLSPPAFVLMFA